VEASVEVVVVVVVVVVNGIVVVVVDRVAGCISYI
jgi:hypothetical protein